MNKINFNEIPTIFGSFKNLYYNNTQQINKEENDEIIYIFQKINKKSIVTKSKALKDLSQIIKNKNKDFIEILLQRFNIIYEKNILTENDNSLLIDLQKVVSEIIIHHPELFKKYFINYFTPLFFLTNYSNNSIRSISQSDLNKILKTNEKIAIAIQKFIDKIIFFIEPILENNSDYIKDLDLFDKEENLDNLFKYLLGTTLMTIKKSIEILGEKNLDTSKIFMDLLFENRSNNKNLINKIINDDNIIIKYTLIEFIDIIFINQLDKFLDKKNISFVMKSILAKIDTEDLNFQKKLWNNNFLKKLVDYLSLNKLLDKTNLENRLKKIIKNSAMGLGETYFNNLIEFLKYFNKFKKENDYLGNLKVIIELVNLFFESSLDEINKYNIKIMYHKGFELLNILAIFENNDNLKLYNNNINDLIDKTIKMFLEKNLYEQTNLNVIGINPLKYFPYALAEYIKNDMYYKDLILNRLFLILKDKNIFNKMNIFNNILYLIEVLEKNQLVEIYKEIIEFYIEVIIDNFNNLNFNENLFLTQNEQFSKNYFKIIKNLFYDKKSYFNDEIYNKFINILNKNFDLIFNKSKLNQFLSDDISLINFNKFFVNILIIFKNDINKNELFNCLNKYKNFINDDLILFNFCFITKNNFKYNNYFKKDFKEIKSNIENNFSNIIKEDSLYFMNKELLEFLLNKFLKNKELKFYESLLIQIKNEEFRKYLVNEIKIDIKNNKSLINYKIKLIMNSFNYENSCEDIFNLIFNNNNKIANYSIDSINLLNKEIILELFNYILNEFLTNKKLINENYIQFNNFLEKVIDLRLINIEEFKNIIIKYLKEGLFNFNNYYHSEIFMLFFENISYKFNINNIFKKLIELYLEEKNINYLKIFICQFYYFNTYDNDIHVFYKNLSNKYFINYFIENLDLNYNNFINLIKEIFEKNYNDWYFIFLLESLVINLFKEEKYDKIKVNLYEDIFDNYYKLNKNDLLNNNLDSNIVFFKLFEIFNNSYFLQSNKIDSSFIINKYHFENFNKNLYSLAYINIKLRETNHNEIDLEKLLEYINNLEENNLKISFKIQFFNILFKENNIELITKYIEEIDKTLNSSIKNLEIDNKINIIDTKFGDFIFINLLKIVSRLINNLEMFSEEFEKNVFNKIINISLEIVNTFLDLENIQKNYTLINPLNLIFEIAETITKFALKENFIIDNSKIFDLLKSKCVPIKSSIYFLIKQYNIINLNKFYEIENKDNLIEKYFNNEMKKYLYDKININSEIFLFYLLNWNLVLNRVENNTEIQKEISEIFENDEKLFILYIDQLFEYVLNKKLDEKNIIKKLKEKKINEIDINWIEKDLLDLNFEIIFNSLYLLCCHFPKTLRVYEMKCKKKYSILLNMFLKTKFSVTLLNREINQIEINQYKWDQDEFKVKIFKNTKDITAIYIKDETEIKINLKMPENYPIGIIDICSNNDLKINNKKKNINFLMKKLWMNHNDSLINVLLLWKNNIDAQFDGQDECLICFYIIDSKTRQLPNKSCRTCKKKFHSYCIEKWFKTSNKSECPACKSQFL